MALPWQGAPNIPGGGILRKIKARVQQHASVFLLLLFSVVAEAGGASSAGSAGAGAAHLEPISVVGPTEIDVVEKDWEKEWESEEVIVATMVASCSLEALACANDAECAACAAKMMMICSKEKEEDEDLWSELAKGSAAAVVAGSTRDSGGFSLDMASAGSSPSSLTFCEKVEAIACCGLVGTAGANASAGEGSDASPTGESFLGNRLVQEVLTCRVTSAGCTPKHLPCRVWDKEEEEEDAEEEQQRESAAPIPADVYDDTPCFPLTSFTSSNGKRHGAQSFGLEDLTSRVRRGLSTSSEDLEASQTYTDGER